MKRIQIVTRYLLLAALLSCFASDASAHPLFMRTLKAKYGFETVSCATCHMKRDNPLSNAPRPERNAFGQRFNSFLEDKDIKGRLQDAKSLKGDGKDREARRIERAIASEFLQALIKVESEKNDAGKTYAELLKAGEVEGVRLPE